MSEGERQTAVKPGPDKEIPLPSCSTIGWQGTEGMILHILTREVR